MGRTGCDPHESAKPVLMSHQPRSTAPTLAPHIPVRSSQLNISNEPKHWHKAAPWLMSAVIFLGLIVIYHN